MNAMMRFIKDEDGLTAVEYVIAASLMAAGLALMFANYGQILQDALVRILGAIAPVPPALPPPNGSLGLSLKVSKLTLLSIPS